MPHSRTGVEIYAPFKEWCRDICLTQGLVQRFMPLSKNGAGIYASLKDWCRELCLTRGLVQRFMPLSKCIRMSIISVSKITEARPL